MAKRFISTEIWDEDWFLEMPTEYKLFWFYILTACDHSGIFRVNLRSFCGLNEVKITSNEALKYFNWGKGRIRIITESIWLIEDFFVYQYGETLNMNNRLHDSIVKLYIKNKIDLFSIRGLKDLKDTLKDKDKDNVFEKNRGVGKGKTLKMNENGKAGKPILNFDAQGAEILSRRIAKRTQEIADRNRKKDNSQTDT